MSTLPDPTTSTPPPVPAGVAHPKWCDPRRCHVGLRDSDPDCPLEPLLVHEGDHWRGLNTAVVLFQCEVLDATLTRVVRTCRPMATIEAKFPEDISFSLDGTDLLSRALDTVRYVRCLPATDRPAGWAA